MEKNSVAKNCSGNTKAPVNQAGAFAYRVFIQLDAVCETVEIVPYRLMINKLRFKAESREEGKGVEP
jgi:hypothetical protein